ncbi:hypothetical protein INR49_011422 [Caranx melampygus]|nr:hypothetical protein INR49_011422 [Caranx melampygus]
MSASEWKTRCETEWGLQGAPMPDGLDWKQIYDAKPLRRNLLRNIAPQGLSKDTPQPSLSRLSMDFEVLILMVVDLKAEGLWEELLDEFQPEIVVQDWYEESRLHESIYKLHVKLLGADKSTVISEHSVSPIEDRSTSSHNWKEVSHMFSGYGPGVRYVHFLHRVKNSSLNGFWQTRATGSSSNGEYLHFATTVLPAPLCCLLPLCRLLPVLPAPCAACSSCVACSPVLPALRWKPLYSCHFKRPERRWKTRCETEWGLQGAPMPDGLDWKQIYDAKPLRRNLLRNIAPQGLSKDTPPTEPDLPEQPDRGPPRFQPDGDFSGWTTSVEVLPYDSSGIPAGAVVCALPQFSWFSMVQVVDLKAEGLWEELLDEFQPEIVVQDWYEETQLHESIYKLHVKLLGADKSTVISEHSVSPTEDCSTYSHNWKEVSHMFSGYGPGVRYVHFLHQVKNSFLNGFWQTRATGSSVTVRPVKTSA